MKKRYLIFPILLILGYFAISKFSTKQVNGPMDVILDKQVCKNCGMHVGDIRFAAQLQTDKETLFFDDPGCLVQGIQNIDEEKDGKIKAIYYHHYQEDRWVAEEDVAFIPVAESPMAHNLAAIDIKDPKENYSNHTIVSLSDARAMILTKKHDHSGNINKKMNSEEMNFEQAEENHSEEKEY